MLTVNYSRQAIKFLNRQDKGTKERIIDNFPSWDDIDEVEPDDVDIAMLRETEVNPDCKIFVSSEEAMKELGLQ